MLLRRALGFREPAPGALGSSLMIAFENQHSIRVQACGEILRSRARGCTSRRTYKNPGNTALHIPPNLRQLAVDNSKAPVASKPILCFQTQAKALDEDLRQETGALRAEATAQTTPQSPDLFQQSLIEEYAS